MVKVLEAVPNFSEGKDLSKIQALVDTIARAGVEVLDWSADPDHHRCVVT
jgi:glutamate formiminotransferase